MEAGLTRTATPANGYQERGIRTRLAEHAKPKAGQAKDISRLEPAPGPVLTLELEPAALQDRQGVAPVAFVERSLTAVRDEDHTDDERGRDAPTEQPKRRVVERVGRYSWRPHHTIRRSPGPGIIGAADESATTIASYPRQTPTPKVGEMDHFDAASVQA